ncbi:hypothetical protein HG535_0H01060 [Zygotorulaspora mrakii]|uniref:Cation/H+ exchanger transmembrane domain-containing protein n=1 Tax=Zygotorulaspora mrakii TaxID=42260 RepID=A0A7H9B8L7_ZYGMR|nr:uncharacterized protein HG535_0H01060 [Zygotorulaspora mrakii]QLG74780.1 hypothetical protein HG535_0H01060 [Zygotorulaspora mrakii]
MASSTGGVISGHNPFVYNSGSPITLFLFQACLILATCNLIHIPFSKLRQPKVISEVIAGVVLGPTVLGQIPNFTDTVFPSSSIPGLNLTANLGIILFMFFLGLEVDTGFIKRHLKKALAIGLVTLAIPFGCGCLLAIPLFHEYSNKDPNARQIKFTVFMVFIAVSLAVTAFPVLCRILNELRLIKDRAGIIVLAAGIVNDIVGWILLALSVILSSASSNPINTVYILLCTMGWFLLYSYPLKYVLRWILIRTHELDRTQPSPMATMFILFIMFISAYFTDIIGVHPIFGAFIAGLIVPRENNYVIKLAERMEDIPNIVLIPLYFAVAGLNVDLTLLNEGRDWGYVFASIGIAISSKILSGSVAAHLTGLFWRESAAVGVLMSCKGIVEIVVLTVGLNAEIIDQKIFGMFILMALVSTFVTTPLTLIIYPESYRMDLQTYLNKEEQGVEQSAPENILKDNESQSYPKNNMSSFQDVKNFHITQVINITNTVETVSSSLEFLNHMTYGKWKVHSEPITLPAKVASRSSSLSASTVKPNHNKIKKLARIWSRKDEDETVLSVIEESPYGFELEIPLKAIHLRLLTERTADLLQSSSISNDDPHYTANSDSLLQIFNIFSRLSQTEFSSEVVFSTMREKATNIVSLDMKASDLVLLPLKGASFEFNGSPIATHEPYSNFEHIHSHILGLNELSSNFFAVISSSLKSSFAMLISNTGDRLNVDRFKKKKFHLLLPYSNLSSSDFLALHIYLLICYRDVKDCGSAQGMIFINKNNLTFVDKFYELLSDQDWFDESVVNVVPIENPNKVQSEYYTKAFIDVVLEFGLNRKDLMDLEESTFIIAERYFSGDVPFENETKELILQGANRKFDVLVSHYFRQC